MTDEERATLEEWAAKLASALGLDEFAPDIDGILDLAGAAARSVVRPAAPLTTFLVGYAAGRAAAGGTETAQAIGDASGTAFALCSAG